MRCCALMLAAMVLAASPAMAQLVFHGERIEQFSPEADLSGQSVPALIRILGGGSDEMRLSAVWYLQFAEGRQERQEAAGALLKVFLEDESATVQRFAGMELEKMLEVKDVDIVALRNVYFDRVQARLSNAEEESTLRAQAAVILGLFKLTKATPALMAALNDESLHVRARAATALGLCGDARAFRPLKEKRDALPEDSPEKMFYEQAVKRLILRMEILAAGAGTKDKGKKKK